MNEQDSVEAIAPTAQERESGLFSPENLARVLGAMNQDGLVVLKDVIAVDIIDKLNRKMVQDVEGLIQDPGQDYNHGVKSNILQRPPIVLSEYLDRSIYFNSFLLQLANAYLGHKPRWNWLTANTALAHTAGLRQPVHKDNNYPHPRFPYYFIANIPLCDFNIENGATEFWLGSHAQTSASHQKVAETADDLDPVYVRNLGDVLPAVNESAKNERMEVRPPIQPLCSRGDIMVRDLRTWHAGMPNSSSSHRIMLGLGYQSPHHPNEKMSLHLPASQKDFFSSDLVEVQAKWYKDEEELAKTKADSVFHTRPSYLD